MRIRTRIKWTAAMAVAAGVGAMGLASAASADPVNTPHPQILYVTCGEQTFVVAGNGNGNWTPVHDTASNSVFIPTSLGNFVGVAYAADGTTVVGGFSDPSFTTRNVGPKNAPRLECSFTTGLQYVGLGNDPEAPDAVYESFSGDGTLFVTPVR